MKNIVITGGAGFIGSHVVRLFVNKYPEYKIINLDKRGDDIASVCVVPTDPEEETAEVAEEASIEVDEEIVSETSEIEEDAEEIDEIEDNAENSEE